MLKNLVRIGLILLTVLALLVVSANLFVIGKAAARADDESGLVGRLTLIQSGASGATAYTTTKTFAANLSDAYGAVLISAATDVTGSQVVTLTPYWSNYSTGLCTSVPEASWIQAEIYQVFSAATASVTTHVVTSTSTLTTVVSSVSALTAGSYQPTMALTGDDSAIMEISAQGRCFRVVATVALAAQTYTPTIYLRFVNRN